MAKSGNVKKGFATYLLILFIAVIAAFFIIVTVMFFSPFKGILGFKYFVYTDSIKPITSIKSGTSEIDIDYSKIDEVVIDCNYADVSIEKSSKVDNGQIYIENKTSGFAREDQDTDFDYNISFTDEEHRKIKIEIKEPEGFLYFNKNIKVVLMTTKFKTDSSFENVKIDVNSTNGKTYVGSNSDNSELDISIGSLSIKNTNGSVYIFDRTKSIENLFIKTNKGYIESRGQTKINNLNIHASKSRIEYSSLNLDNATIDIGNSDFTAQSLTINNTANLLINNGYFTVNSLTGNITSNSMVKDMGSAEINIKNLNGNLVIPNANKSKINLDKTSLSSQIYIRGKGSNVNINELKNLALIETTSGNVKVNVVSDSGNQPEVNIKTTSGNINLDYDSSYLQRNSLQLSTSSGDIDLKMRNTMAFTLNVYKDLANNYAGTFRNSKNISVESFDGDFAIPLNLNGGGTPVDIISNGHISLSFIKA